MYVLDADVHAEFRAGPGRVIDRPLALVHGNCQAESLRAVLGDGPFATVRLPPVHELTARDAATLADWLPRASVLIAQPIRRGYRGLPIGTADLVAAAGPRTRVVIVPVVRFAGLYPESVIVRPPGEPGAVPPVIPYHSLRTLAHAAGRDLAPLRAAAVREIAADSVRELARREREHGTVVVSDLLVAPRFALMRTVNHPGNEIWTAIARRTYAALGVDAQPSDPGRPLLDAIHAPRDPAVIAAFELDDPPDDHWLRDGVRISTEAVSRAHLAWYADHPGTVAAGCRRHARALATIGCR